MVVTTRARLAVAGATAALLTAAVATPAQAASTVPAAAAAAVARSGVPAASHPLPREFVSTTLPTRVAVGGPEVSIGYSVSFRALDDDSGVQVELVGVGPTDQFPTTPTQTRVDGRYRFPATAVGHLGPVRWLLTRTSRHGSGDSVELAARTGLRSLIAVAPTRHGDSVRVVGALKGYDIGSRSYPARPGRPVALQRYAGAGRWVTVRSLTTDRLGHVDATVRIPWRVGLRLTTPDTATRLGAASAGATV